MRKIQLTLVFFALALSSAFAQTRPTHKHVHTERCGTVQHQREQLSEVQYQQKVTDFEEWLQKKMRNARLTDDVLTIPVVVHVIHNGEPVGTTENPSDQDIIDHLAFVQRDFNLQNPAVSRVPSEFQDVLAAVEFEFCLAQRDPEGLPTTGIVRVNGGRESWGYNDNRALKSKSYWPAEDYVNFWFAPIIAGGLLGYAQPPETDLPGWEGFGDFSRTTDGIVVDPFVIDHPTYEGTTTHELGHFFSLRHIWGDGPCGVDDYCDDTPEAGSASSGCNAAQETCGSLDMIQNFMDYSDCISVFTQDQEDRMRTVMAFSPRRASLLNSPACSAPIVTAYNAGIRSASSPTQRCAHDFNARVELRNYGTENLTSVNIGYRLDGDVVNNFYEWTGNLGQYEVEEVQLPGLFLPPGFHRIEFFTNMPNGEADGDPDNDDFIQEFQVVDEEEIGKITFEGVAFPPTENWIIDNPDGSFTWRDTLMQNGNTAVCIDFANYSARGQSDRLNTPIWDLAGMDNPTLEFRVAYGRVLQGGDPIAPAEGLRVTVSNNCGRVNIPVYNKSRDELATMADVALTEEVNSSAPQSDGDWRTERVDLSRFKGEKVIISFQGQNDFGNVLWIDDIEVTNVTGLEDNLRPLTESVEVFPNPSTGRFKLRLNDTFSERLEISVLDITGRSLQAFSFENPAAGELLELNLSDLPKGVYSLRLQAGEQQVVKRVVLQ